MLYKEDVVHIYIGILLTIKKNKLMPFAATWMDLEITILSEVRQWKTSIIWYHFYGESKKDTNELTAEQKQTHRFCKQSHG